MKIALFIIISLSVGCLIGFFTGQMFGYEKRTSEQNRKSYGELVTELRAKEILSIHDMVKVSSKVKTVDEGGFFSVKNVDYLSGTIENIAMATAIRDIKLRIDFLSTTNTVISSQEVIIYDIVAPSRAKDFKEKIKMPEETKQWQLSLVDLKTD